MCSVVVMWWYLCTTADIIVKHIKILSSKYQPANTSHLMCSSWKDVKGLVVIFAIQSFYIVSLVQWFLTVSAGRDWDWNYSTKLTVCTRSRAGGRSVALLDLIFSRWT